MVTLASQVCLHFFLHWRKEEARVWTQASRVGLPRWEKAARPGMLACAEGSVGGRLLFYLIPPEREEAVV